MLERNVGIKDDDRLIVFDMRYYPVDLTWLLHLLEKLRLTDVPLVVLHSGRSALIGAHWANRAEDMDSPETAVIENIQDRLADIGQTDNVLRLVSSNFSLRFFNRLRYGRTGYFQKRSADAKKMRAEHSFFSTLPVEVRPFFPVVGAFTEDAGEAGYEIEIIPAFDVARLLLHGRFADPNIADSLIKALEAYLDACPKITCQPQEYTAKMRDLFADKTRRRIRELAELRVSARLDLTCRVNDFDSLEDFAAEHLALVEKNIAEDTGNELVFSHGDLFFSNILFDPLSGKIKCIDPRGGDGDAAFLPAWYDMAKLSHSFLGRYDMLVYDEFSVNMAEDISLHIHIVDMPGADGLKERFLDFLNRKQIDLAKTRLFEAALFLSMLPLHADSPLRMQGQLLRALDIHRRLTTPGAPLCGTWRGGE